MAATGARRARRAALRLPLLASALALLLLDFITCRAPRCWSFAAQPGKRAEESVGLSRRAAPSVEFAPAVADPVAEAWESGDRGLELSSADVARLRLESGSNIFALTTEADLEMLLAAAEQSGRLVVVDYYAGFCRLCRQLLRQLERIAQDAEFHEILFASVSYEESRSLFVARDVSKFPTVEIYRGGELRQRWAGSSRKRLLQRLRAEAAEAVEAGAPAAGAA